MAHRAVFLDRDGTINIDYGYIYKRSQWKFMPGVLAALRLLTREDWLLVVVSNQSGIGRGYYSQTDLTKLQTWVHCELLKRQIRIADWLYCPHLPQSGCACRKPAPGMLLKAARSLDISLPSSWMLGDKCSDLQAGLAAGCNAGLVSATSTEISLAHTLYPDIPIWSDLMQAARAITRKTKIASG